MWSSKKASFKQNINPVRNTWSSFTVFMQTLKVDQHYLVRVITKTLTLPKHGCIITKSHEQNKIKNGQKNIDFIQTWRHNTKSHERNNKNGLKNIDFTQTWWHSTESHEQNKIKMSRKTLTLPKHGDIILNLMSKTVEQTFKR